MTATKSLSETIVAIELELKRLGAYPIFVAPEDSLPPGVVQVREHGTDPVVVAQDYLDGLRQITDFNQDPESDSSGFNQAATLAGELEISEEDLRDLYQLEEVWRNDEETPEQGCGRATVYKLQTNAGTRYAGVADSINQCPIREYRDNNCEFCETLEEAQAECVGDEMVFNHETGKYECVESQDD